MKAGRAVPLRPLLTLSAVVLVGHMLLLSASPGHLQFPDALGTRPLITRTIAIGQSLAPTPQAGLEQPTHRPAPAPRLPGTMQIAESALAPEPARAAVEPPTATQPAPAPVIETAAQASVPAPALSRMARESSSQSTAFTVPGSVRLHYKVSAQVRNQAWQANGELLWRHDGDNYEAKLEVSAPLLPSRTQRSTGRITAQGLAPVRFSDKSRSEQAAHFERDKGKISFSGNQPDAPLLAGAQDRLSVLLQLASMIAGDPRKFPTATTIEIQTASTREAEPWLFTVEAEEELRLPGGTVAALKLTRNPRHEFDQKVELWLAPAMDYVPVRLRLTQPKGDWVDQQWSSTDRG